MKARVVSLNKDKKYMEIDLINSNGIACLHTQVYGGSYIKIFYCFKDAETGESYLSLYDEMKKAKYILVNNIGKIINKAFSIFNYDRNEVKSIEFTEGYTVFIMLVK